MPPGLCWGPSEIDSTIPLEDEQLVGSTSSSSLISSNSQSLLPSPSLSSLSLPGHASSSSKASSSVRMPLLALGTGGNLHGKDLRRSIRTAILDYGYRHLDCASSFGNESQIGEILAELFQEKRISRKDLFITSKLWNNAHGPPNSGRVLAACLQTLSDLKLTYLDCYLIQFPVAFVPAVSLGTEPASPGQIDWNLTGNLQETWASMEELVDKGLVRTIGVSNFEIQHLEQILNPSPPSSSSPPTAPISIPSSSFSLRIRPRVNQIETHPYLQCSELVDYCHRHSIAVMAYSPLGSPNNLWTSRRNLGLPSLLDDPIVEDISERLERTPSQILIRWALQRGNDRGTFMGAIVKSSDPDHIKSNSEVFDFRLSPEDMRELNSRNRGTRFNHPITPWLGRGSFPRNVVLAAAAGGRQ